MHMTSPISVSASSSVPPLDFVWLELTNRCNLQCTHCYAESSPTSGEKDILTEDDYLNLIDQLSNLGCRKLQFIGGEPTLNRSLPRLIQAAFEKHFEFIEVFTNLTRLSDDLLRVFCRCEVAVATSFYSHISGTHDAITGQIGSFERTVGNMLKVLEAGLQLRAGIIVMEQNTEEIAETWTFLQRMGVKRIGSDHVRRIGRANSNDSCDMRELCGSCSGNILSIGPDGVVAPCNMSKHWAVGSVLDKRLNEIVSSPELARVRKEIKERVVDAGGRRVEAVCDPKTCGPYSVCCPSTQQCFPCAPNGCIPCFPKG